MDIKRKHHGICELAQVRINTHASNEWHRVGTALHHDGERRAVLPLAFEPGGAIDHTLDTLAQHRINNSELHHDHYIAFTLGVFDARHDQWMDALPITDGDTREGEWAKAVGATSEFYLHGVGNNPRDIVMALPPHVDPYSFDHADTFDEFRVLMEWLFEGGAYVVNIQFVTDEIQATTTDGTGTTDGN